MSTSLRSFVRPVKHALYIGVLLLAAFSLAGCDDDDDTFYPASYDVPNSVGIADLDGDGEMDIAVAATRVIYGASDYGFLSVLLQDPGTPGAFVDSQEVRAGYRPATLALGNLDDDSAVDVAVANAGSGDTSVFLQDAGTPGSFLPASFINTGGTQLDLAIADIDGDGADDVAIASFESDGSVYVAYGDPLAPGDFEAPVSLAIDRPVTSVAIGDLDGDLRPDLAVGVQDSDGSDGAVAVLIQDPGTPRQFLAAVEYPAGTEPLSVRIADLDGDDRPDLALVNEGPGLSGQGSAGMTVILQDPVVAGTFLAPVTYAAGSRPEHLAVGDLNADDRPDIAVANSGGYQGSVQVLLQDPVVDGVFLSAESYPGFFGPLGVAIGDLNQDGLPDIAAADGDRATVMFQQPGNPGIFDEAVPVGD